MTKKLLSGIIALAMLVSSGIPTMASTDTTVIYVSATGSNDNLGTLSAPLKTIDAARAKAREIDGHVTVEIMGGEYRLTNEIIFEAEDSNVTYRAYNGEKPVIKGSKKLATSAAKKVTEDLDVYSKLTDGAKENTYVIDLAAQGITKPMIMNTANINTQYGVEYGYDFNSLYIDGVMQTVAQWPNNRDYAEHLGVNDTRSIKYAEDYCDKWSDETGWWIGMWMPYDYSYFKFSAASMDTANNVITYIDNPATVFEKSLYSKRWKAYNLIEEMDVPGEYYIDRDNLKLYYYSPKAIENQTIELDINLRRMITVTGAENISFEGLTFTQTNSSVFSVSDVVNVDIKNCVFEDIGYNAVGYGGEELCQTGTYYTENGTQVEHWQKQRKNGSYDVDVSGNIFNNIGSTAVNMSAAGDIDTLTPSRNVIENNIFSNIGYKSVHPVISIGGCGITVRNNNISKSTIGAVYVTGGNEHLIEKNEIYNVMTESADWGAFYEGGNDVFRGTEVNYNYIHDMVADDNKAYAGLKTGRVGIYFDENQQGLSAEHNIIKNVPIAFNSNHAGNFLYQYNTAVDSGRAYSLHNHPNETGETVKTGALGLTISQVAEMVNGNELFYTTYPTLKTFVETATNPMKWTVINENLEIGCGESNIGTQATTYSTMTNNKEITDYSVFNNPDAQDYRLKADAEIATTMPNQLNTTNFDIEEIGIQTGLQLNENTASFANIFPAKGSSIAYQEEYNFSWEPALGANYYNLTVATDKEFDNVVFEKRTMQTGAVVTGLSDETTYYYKVEAENISRELGTTWLSEGGVVEFGINVDMYEDTATPEMPANLTTGSTTGGSNIPTWSGSGIPDEMKEGSNWAIKMAMSSDRTDKPDSNWYATGIFLVDKAAGSGAFKPAANTDYVFKVKARAAEGNVKIGLANIDTWGKYVVADHGKDGVQVGTDWTEMKTTISTVDNSAYNFNYLGFGIVTGAASDYIIYDVNSMYLAEEIEYSMNIQGDEKVRVGESKVYSAEVLNQLGEKGALSQDFEWIVLNESRTAVDEGLTVLENADGTVTLTGAKTGIYTVIARTADGFTKGMKVKVVASYNDTESPEKPVNLISVGGAAGATTTIWTANDIPEEMAEGTNWAIKLGLASDRLEGVDSNWYSTGIFLKDRNKNEETQSANAFLPESNTNYVFQAKARSVEGNVKIGLANVDTWGKYVLADHGAEGVQIGTDWTEVKTTLATKDTSAYRFNYLSFGIVTGAASDYIVYDANSMYLAEEIAYSMNIEGADKVMIGEEKTYSAEILNQLGLKGHLSQDFEWTVLNANRTQAVDSMEVTENADGTVTVKGVKGGTYTLLATASEYDFVKGIQIEITSAEDTESPEKPANLITGGAAAGVTSTWTGQNLPADMTEGSNYAIKIAMSSDRTDKVDSNYYATGIFLKDKDKNGDTTSAKAFMPKANTNYVFQVKARSVEGNVRVGLANIDIYNKYVIANHGKDGIQVGKDWTDVKTTLSTVDNSEYNYNYVMFGIVTGTASDYIVYDVNSMYMAEEIAYSMNIEGDSRVAVGEDKIYSAELLNQVGLKGALSQDFNWALMNEDRSALVDGATVVENADGTVTVTGVEAGTYTLVAISEDGFVKGKLIKVIADYSDTVTPEKPAKLTVGSTTGGSTIATWSGSGIPDEMKEGSSWAIKMAMSSDRTDKPDNNWYASGIFLVDKAAGSGAFKPKANTTYVFSVKVRAAEGNVKLGLANNNDYGKYVLADHGAEGVQIGTDWTEFKTTLSTEDTSTYRFNYLSFGIVTGAASDYFIYDVNSMYLAEEIAYSMNITGESEIKAGEENIYTAELLNQIGTKGALSQDFDWLVMNEDRSAVAEDVTLVENADGTVTVKALEEGTYTIIAISEDDFIKGYTVTVTAGEEPQEKIASAVFTKSGTSVNFKASVENTTAENIFFVIGEFNGKSLVKTAKSDVKPASDANCDLTLDNVTVGNTVRAFIWNNGTLLPIDNVDGLALDYAVTE